MRTRFVKKLLWVLNTLLVAGIVVYALFFFILGGVNKRGPRSAETVLGRANLPQANPDVKPQSPDPVSSYRFTYELSISGDPPPEPVDEGPKGPEKQIPPLAQNYELLWTKVDLGDPLLSFAHLRRKGTDRSLDVLAGQKVEGVWKLTLVEEDKAHFIRDEAEGEVVLEVARPETVKFGEGSAGGGGSAEGIVGIDPAAKPPRDSPTREAVEVRPGSNIWEVPPEETRWWEAWGEEAAQEVAVQTWNDPETKRPAGLMIKDIKQGSVIQRRGVQSGDILKAINGVRVTSRQEAIAYVKGPGKGLTRYVATIERRGREFNITYNVRSTKRADR